MIRPFLQYRHFSSIALLLCGTILSMCLHGAHCSYFDHDGHDADFSEDGECDGHARCEAAHADQGGENFPECLYHHTMQDISLAKSEGTHGIEKKHPAAAILQVPVPIIPQRCACSLRVHDLFFPFHQQEQTRSLRAPPALS